GSSDSTSGGSTGGGQGAPATLNDATWLHRFAPNSFWTLPGGDFQSAASATGSAGFPGIVSFSSPDMQADVQLWLDQPGDNHGWLLKHIAEGTTGSAVAVGSREAIAPVSRPQLVIDYTPQFSTFCDPSDPNSTGLSTQLMGTLLPTTSPPRLFVEANQGPPGEFVYLLVGSAPQDPGLPLGSGHLCLSVQPPNVIGRYNVAPWWDSIGTFGANGVYWVHGASSPGYELLAFLVLPGNPLILAGSEWHFQMWHRDVGTTSNFSNGLTVRF
ncbi:MAG TPA: hypothetical protein PLJ12_06505, partial [Planctomycetota bacterium]|nr:hypothetical protein [Planctomycetota bacterium]